MYVRLILLVFLLCSCGACVGVIEPYAVTSEAELAPQDWVGEWHVTEIADMPDVVSTTVFITHTAGSSYAATIVGTDTLSGTLQLSAGPECVLAAFRAYGDDTWFLAGLITDDLASGVVALAFPSPAIFSEAIAEGVITGTVSTQEFYGPSVSLPLSGAQLRSFVDAQSMLFAGGTVCVLARMVAEPQAEPPVPPPQPTNSLFSRGAGMRRNDLLPLAALLSVSAGATLVHTLRPRGG